MPLYQNVSCPLISKSGIHYLTMLVPKWCHYPPVVPVDKIVLHSELLSLISAPLCRCTCHLWDCLGCTTICMCDLWLDLCHSCKNTFPPLAPFPLVWFFLFPWSQPLWSTCSKIHSLFVLWLTLVIRNAKILTYACHVFQFKTKQWYVNLNWTL